jgi:hypothetical protein
MEEGRRDNLFLCSIIALNADTGEYVALPNIAGRVIGTDGDESSWRQFDDYHRTGLQRCRLQKSPSSAIVVQLSRCAAIYAISRTSIHRARRYSGGQNP